MKVSLVALKPMRYRTRALRAGDSFECGAGEARIFVGARLAADAPAKDAKPAPVPAPPSVSYPDALAELRAEYQALTGKKPHPRWAVTRLKGEIAALKSQTESESSDSEIDSE